MTNHLKNDRGARPRAVRFVLLAAIVSAVALPSVVPAPVSASPTPQAKLTAAAGTEDAKFGTSVSIDGNTAVVGAPDEGGMGAAYVFTRRGGTWVEQATLVAPERTEGEKFGYDVAISGDTIVVGAPNAEQTRPIADAGVAYVFVRTPGGWSPQAKLSPSDSRADDAFGFGVAISGDTVLVGANGGTVLPSVAPGAAYVFTRLGGAWSEQAKLTPAGSAADDNFGFSVALSGDTALVSMAGGDVGGADDQGSARVFKRRGSTWTEQATLTATDGGQLGGSTSISGDTVVIGAAGQTIGTNPQQGAAYVFTRSGDAWTQTAKLTAPDGEANDAFGVSVVATDRHFAVGAHFAEDRRGAVYVFERVASGLAAPTKLSADDSQLGGVSVWMSGHTLISGASFTAVDGKRAQGAAYVFDLRQ